MLNKLEYIFSNLITYATLSNIKVKNLKFYNFLPKYQEQEIQQEQQPPEQEATIPKPLQQILQTEVNYNYIFLLIIIVLMIIN